MGDHERDTLILTSPVSPVTFRNEESFQTTLKTESTHGLDGYRLGLGLWKLHHGKEFL